ncbi:MAG: hypothetical protein WBN65_01610, partial [Gammaproteobacteria bacterium]
TQAALIRLPLLVLFGLITAGCGGSNSGGTNITSIPLPTDTLLNLSCEEAGVWPDPCVASDPQNPYRTAIIREFDVNNPDAETKFDLAGAIPAGRTGAKARFYLWATALARRASGENQWYTARALHELYNYNDDPVIQAQALKAYRSVLDNFFGSATFFECCSNLDPNGDPVPFSIPLNELTADDLYRTDATGWKRLIPGDPLLAISEMADWGYSYQPATPPSFDNGVVSVNDG